MVLGEKIGEEKGKVIGVSIKAIDSEGIHVEETLASEVKGFGRFPGGRNMGTLNMVETPSGGVSGTGQGIVTSQDGDIVAWKCYVLGKSQAGKTNGVAIIQFMTTSQKLSWMNGLIIVEETVADSKTMEFSGTAYEWK